MPPFVFRAPSPYDYPASRDARGVPLGTVQPGDVRNLDEAIDRWWVPVDGSEGHGQDESTEAAEGTAPDPAPDGPVPAPPAVIANP